MEGRSKKGAFERMISITKKLTPYNYTAMFGKKNLYIVVHYVGSVSTAKNNAEYFANNRVEASAHYFVDENSIYQSVEDCNKAWHCGGGLQGREGHTFYQKCTNSNSIGIEMCVKKKSGTWYYEDKTVINTVKLIKKLMKTYNIPLENVIRHYDVTGKECPALYTDQMAWQAFKNKIIQEETDMEEIKKLQEQVVALEHELANQKPMVYNYIDANMPEWAVPTIRKLCEKGVLRGNENGELGLGENMLRMLVVNDRVGLYD